MQEKNGRFLVLLQEVPDFTSHFSNFTKERSDQKWNIAAIYELQYLNPHFPTMTELQSLIVGDDILNNEYGYHV